MARRESNGILIGVVSDLEDPESLGRVKVDFPHLPRGRNSSDWARLASPMAGKDRGFFFRPEKGDEVLVAFEHGDCRRPYIIGALWSKADKPPADDGDQVKNNWRFIRSRSGHMVKLDDTPGAERIEVLDKDKNCQIILDPVGKKVEVKCQKGDIAVSTGKGAVSVDATTVSIHATNSLTLEADGKLVIRGKTVHIN